ncbi:hypothetical protein GIB67_013574 [Kingdonia uniflora]|uniref:DYW domain-containing protein n=1 Tax=Kingdonia uniflora TaxID=39325 RepID=A0A7J7KV19_9MAGN|nr:hypothetical protein GIB67_013574 [Kingdonia uniflora]
MRSLMKERNVVKFATYSWIEIDQVVQKFVSDGQTHSQADRIYKELDRLIMEVKKNGFIHDLQFTHHDVGKEEKVESICYHSEKLALAFGLIRKLRSRTPIRIIKNIRVCGECNVFMKFVSKLTGTAGIPLDLLLNMSLHLSPVDLQVMGQTSFVDYDQFVIRDERKTYASYWTGQTEEVCHLLTDSQRMGNVDLFRSTTARAGITPMVIMSASFHSLSQDFSLPGESDGPDSGWHMEWTGRHEILPIHRLRDLPPISAFYGAEELLHLTHAM